MRHKKSGKVRILCKEPGCSWKSQMIPATEAGASTALSDHYALRHPRKKVRI